MVSNSKVRSANLPPPLSLAGLINFHKEKRRGGGGGGPANMEMLTKKMSKFVFSHLGIQTRDPSWYPTRVGNIPAPPGT